ncbi:MAG: sel1 repeat family protein [Kofleriaceae bacterium]|nr:sel1 repeat family protein [Kofleriaceae bacterium]
MATLQLATRPPSQRRFATNRYRAGGLLLIVLAVACKKPAQDTASQRTDVSPALSVVAAPVAAGSNESEAAAQARDATYQQACKGGDMVSCTNLGVLYEQGIGVPKDATKAAALFEQACKGGDMVGCANLGILHADGTGVPKDATKAAALFQQACAGGLAQACNR